MKCCHQCRETLPLSCFHKDRSKSDGFYPICKTCRKPRTQKQYQENRTEVRRRAKDRYHADPKKHREASARYRAEVASDPERLEAQKAYHKAYYRENKDKWSKPDPVKKRIRNAAYRRDNPEKIRTYLKQWHRKNPHYGRFRSLKMKVTPVSAEQLQERLEQFNHCCAYCLVDLRTLPPFHRTMDHVIPIAAGGPHTQENLVPSCRSCNSRKGDRPITFMLNYT